MPELTALDIDLGPALAATLRRYVRDRRAVCILDRRLSTRQQRAQLEAFGATQIDDGSGPRPLDGRPIEDGIGLVMLTSGSSGNPKAAQITWEALVASATMTQSALRRSDAPVWFAMLPPAHIGGLAVLLRAILTDGALVWPEDTAPESARALGATHVAVVRAHLSRFDLSGYEVVLLGGAKPPGAVDDNVVTTWGMTETGSGVVYNARALQGVDVVALDGELLVRSPTLFHSYRDAPRPRRLGPDGRDDWFPTGDAGDVVDGVVSVHGRLAFVINTGGEKVWPEELENALGTVDGVRDVAVTGVDDPEWGERVVALVVSDGRECDDELRDTASERIGPWAKPKEIRYVTAIPRTPSGKISRSQLRHLY